MTGRRLKNYKTYLGRIKNFAHAMSIKIEYGEIDEEGIWMPWVRKIKISDDISQSEEIAALLHELGHSMDDMTTNISDKILFKAYDAFYEKKPSKKEIKIVQQCEKKAWKYGREIAIRLKIPIGKWFDDFEKTCLKSYRHT